jgi:hypothetical protein
VSVVVSLFTRVVLAAVEVFVRVGVVVVVVAVVLIVKVCPLSGWTSQPLLPL